MILVVHILLGALIGLIIPHQYWLVFVVAFASHFLLDAIPHYEYKIQLLKERAKEQKGIRNIFGDKKAFLILGKVATDFLLGILIAISLVWFSPAKQYALVGALSAALPDGLLALYWVIKTPPLEKLARFHRFVHPKNNKNTPPLWGISTQLIVGLIAIFLILYCR
jgi:archaellum biogenesis protein FlaJ (TadC family)